MTFRFVVLTVFLAAVCTLARGESDRPNILWIVADDMSPDMGCYGDPYARTPNLDRLASQGARFTHAFSIAAQCAPSRSSLITGMYATSIGSHHMRSLAVPPPYVKCFTEYLRAEGYYCTNDFKVDYNFGRVDNVTRGVFDPPTGAWDESRRGARWRARKEGQPFFAVVNIATTHESRVRFPEPQFQAITKDLAPEDRHDPETAQLPPYYPDTPIVRQDWARYYDLVTALDMQVGELLEELEEDGLAQHTIVLFFGDHGRPLPRAKRWLYDSGIRVPLLVRWPGVIRPGALRDDLVHFVDFAPTVLSLAGVNVPGHMQGRIFLGKDTAPGPDYVFAARDRSDQVYDFIRSVRGPRYHYIRNFEPQIPYATPIPYMDKMPTMQEWRRLHAEGALQGPSALFFAAEKPVEELYDTESDPHEIRNLAGQPEYGPRRREMALALDRWMDESNDLGRVPEAELFEKMRPDGRWERASEPAVHPAGGSFMNPPEISMTCETPGNTIVYTTDKGARSHWELYSKPITLSGSAVLRVRAGRLGFNDSSEGQYIFEILKGRTGSNNP